MLYMLDTNIVSYLLEKDATVVEKFESVFLQNDFAISNIVKYEIQHTHLIRLLFLYISCIFFQLIKFIT